jgi:hypothetical protein
MTELQRVRRVISLQGEDQARAWARSIASIYLELIKNPQHYASQSDWKPIFEKSAQELRRFAVDGALPPEENFPSPFHE